MPFTFVALCSASPANAVLARMDFGSNELTHCRIYRRIWLGSNDALPLPTRMETRLPWRPTRGSLTSPSYLVRNRTLGPPLENNPEIPPSSRDEGLRLLHGLETNLAASLQTPQEA